MSHVDTAAHPRGPRTIAEVRAGLDRAEIGRALHDDVSDLYPLCRSLTGDGLRETLRRLQRRLPLTLHEVPTGTDVFDWTIPREWNIRDAYVKNARGERVIDFQASNLHVVSYSMPVHRRMSLAELRPHLHTLPDRPDWIPYRAAFYSETWGFCLSQRQLEKLPDGEYEVCIDSTLEPGSLTYGECVVPGESTDEVLISVHVCHPALANDNLSGITIAAHLGRLLAPLTLRYTYRFLFLPGTIGPITWLARNEAAVPRIRHGLVLVCLGDAGRFTYKKSRRGDAAIDRAAAHVLRHAGAHEVQDFSPYGYGERQYCSPGFDLPVGRLSRTPHGCFPEYHTSADNLDFVSPEQLADSLATILQIFDVLEHDRTYLNQSPKCEPQLGKRGLYREIGDDEMAMLWVLNQSDGRHSLLDIAERSGCAFGAIRRAAGLLEAHGLLKEHETLRGREAR
jgi:aminopeptidase-like protein